MSTVFRSLFSTLLVSLALTGCNISAPGAMVLVTQAVEPPALPSATPEDLAVTGGPTPDLPVETQNVVLVLTPAPVVALGQAAPTTVEAFSPEKPCDQVQPGQPFDVTVPDGTPFSPGQPFTKTWRLVNSGSCAWTREYAVVWFSGEPISTEPQSAFASEVAPGAMVDVTVDMVAPHKPGVYQSNWKLRNSQGEFFGIGPNGDAPFWVMVEVREESTATVPVEPSPVATSAVYANGIVSLLLADGLDLDNAALNAESGADIRYQSSLGGEVQILPENGAKIGLFGDLEPEEADCVGAPLGFVSLTVPNAEAGTYVCYRTSQGLPGFAHVIRVGDAESPLALDFITWSAP
jgi:hypothetical protein